MCSVGATRVLKNLFSGVDGQSVKQWVKKSKPCVCKHVGTFLCRMDLCKVAMEKLIIEQTVS